MTTGAATTDILMPRSVLDQAQAQAQARHTHSFHSFHSSQFKPHCAVSHWWQVRARFSTTMTLSCHDHDITAQSVHLTCAGVRARGRAGGAALQTPAASEIQNASRAHRAARRARRGSGNEQDVLA
ncbi:hypothetical protein AcV7_003547 [Taiwanofungus camphoratus]|nr:hypothetical protein AcV7_003547 [Antrodia cinnamomea]